MKYKLNKTKKCSQCKYLIGWMNLAESNETPCCKLNNWQDETEWVTEDCPMFALKGADVK